MSSSHLPPYAFVIMPIGRPQLDKLWDDAIRPSIEDKRFGLNARRVDKHHEGGMLGNHILDLIDNATIIVADLTHGRPNVYLEVGYALRAHQRHETGTRKNPRLILMAREDHNNDSLNFRKRRPEKIHFDLEGYGILWWTDAEDYRKQLTEQIERRLKMVDRLTTSVAVAAPVVRRVIDMEWVEKRQEYVNLRTKGLDKARTEFTSGVQHNRSLDKSSKDLIAAIRGAPRYGYGVAHIFGDAEYAPKALPGGGLQATSPHGWSGTQYWALSSSGQFFRSSSLTEDSPAFTDRGEREPGTVLWIDSRIREFAETLAFVAFAYTEFGLPVGSEVQFRYGVIGLSGRRVGIADPNKWWRAERGTSEENVYSGGGSFALGSLAERLTDLVNTTLTPMLELFEVETEWEPILRKLTLDIQRDLRLAGL